MEFEESRPYAPGDDLRHLDWRAMARTGEPYVKHFREERDQQLLLVLDVSASMRFGSDRRLKSTAAAHAVALLAVAATQVGDRVGLFTYNEQLRDRVAIGKGPAHCWQIVDTAIAAAASASGGTRLESALESLRHSAQHRSSIVFLSDFRDRTLAAPDGDAAGTSQAALASLCRRHDVLSIVLSDSREAALPRVGRLQLSDPECPRRHIVLDSNSPRVRERYRRAFRLRRRLVEGSLRRAGSDVLWLDSAQDPLRILLHHFRTRALRTSHRAG